MLIILWSSGIQALQKKQWQDPTVCRLDAVQSYGQLDCRLQPNSHNAHKDLNYLNEEKRNESRQAEQPIEAATAMKLHKLCNGVGSHKRSQFEAAIIYEDFVIPKPDYIWLGKFQIHRSEGIASIRFGIQAHLSTYASQKFLKWWTDFLRLLYWKNYLA